MAYLLVTIDTEEDNWGEYTRAAYSVENIGRIDRLQRVFERRNVRPTYFITHPVATQPESARPLAMLQRRGACEIGTHLHAWNTPPVVESRTAANSFLCNLPPDLQEQKLRTLHHAIADAVGIVPTSYRSGRWGFDDNVALNLIRVGYHVDSSVHPLWDWSSAGGPDFTAFGPEPFVYQQIAGSGPEGRLLEIPASNDFLQPWRRGAGAVHRTARRAPLAPDKVVAALAKLRVVNHICLSPEVALASHMIALAEAMLSRGARVLNMYFHSPSLLPGCSPFVRTEADADAFIERIDAFLAFAQARGLVSTTFRELDAAKVGATVVRPLDSTMRAPLAS